MVHSLSHFDKYIYVTAEGFAAPNINKYGVDESLLLLLQSAGVYLKTQYGIANTTMDDELTLSKGYAQILEDPTYSLLVTAPPDVISKYNIDDRTQLVDTRNERLSALLNDIKLADKGASLKVQTKFSSAAYAAKSATNLNAKLDNGVGAYVPLAGPESSGQPSNTHTYIDSSTYDKVHTLLQDKFGRADLSDDPEKLEAINTFLRTFPYRNQKKDGSASGPWVNMTVKQLFRDTIQTAIDIINDVSDIVSKRNLLSDAEYRRSLFDVFARKSRRTYVGFWMIFMAFMLYFIDSST